MVCDSFGDAGLLSHTKDLVRSHEGSGMRFQGIEKNEIKRSTCGNTADSVTGRKLVR